VEIWSEKMNDFFRARLVTAKFFEDATADLQGGGDIVHVSNLTEMSANTKSNATAVTLNSPTETDVDLTVNTWKEVSFMIEDLEAAKVKQSYRIQERYARNAAYTAAAAYEDAIIALFDNFTTSTGSSTLSVGDSDIRAAIQALDVANVPSEDRGFFFHPSIIWGDLMAIDKYVNFDYTTTRPVDGGGIADSTTVGTMNSTELRPQGSLYGIPVYSSTRLPVVLGSRVGCFGVIENRDNAGVTILGAQ
jgi:hypothetical protein